MKTKLKALASLAMVFLLASCSLFSPGVSKSVTPIPVQTVRLADTAAPTATPDEASNSPTPTFTPIPLPTINIIPDLPDPALWVSSLKIDAKDYPRVDGSTANIPLGIYMRAKITGQTLAECTAATAFTKTDPSYYALANGETDLLVVYESSDDTKAWLESSGNKLTIKPIGVDALVFLTNEGNPVKSLTHKQIVDIYTGKIKKWNEVGGEKVEIIPYQRILNSGSQTMMRKLVMKDTPMMEAPAILQPAEMGALVDAVASYDNTKNALGYSVFYYVRNMYQLPGIKLLSVNGVTPDSKSIASGKYPYINPFYAVIRENEPKDSPARRIFDWLTGAEGKKVMEEAGYVPAP